MIPLFHDFEDETVLIVGGGPVGARKARRFAREASVVVCSDAFADRDFGGAARVRTLVEPADADDWVARSDPALVVAATGEPAVDDAFEAAARDHGALVNRADKHGGREAGSVVVPATIRDDPVVVGLSTGGQSPAVSRYLRERLEPELAGAGAMAELTGDLRIELRETDLDASERREAIRAVVRSRDVWTALDSGTSNARQRAVDVIETITGETT